MDIFSCVFTPASTQGHTWCSLFGTDGWTKRQTHKSCEATSGQQSDGDKQQYRTDTRHQKSRSSPPYFFDDIFHPIKMHKIVAGLGVDKYSSNENITLRELTHGRRHNCMFDA